MDLVSRWRTALCAGIAVTAVALGTAACGGSSSHSAGGGSGGGLNSGFGGSAGSGGGSGSSAGATTVNIAIPASAPEYALPAIAVGNHLFPKNINVKWTILPGSEIIAPLTTGQDPLAVTASPEPEVAVANTHKQISWVAQWGDPSDFQIIARPGVKSIQQLKGKPIGVTTPDSATWFLARVGMAKSGVGANGFSSVNLGTIGAIISAFSAGKVQAIVLSSTVGEGVLKTVPGSKVVYDFYNQKFPWSGSGLAGYMPWVKSHQSVVHEVLQGLQKAEVLLHKNPKAAVGPLASFVGASPSSQTVKIDMQQLLQKTPKSLQPTSADTESNVLSILRGNGTSGATSSLASKMIDNSYLEQVVK